MYLKALFESIQDMKRLFFACFIVIVFSLTPVSLFARATDLSPAVSDLTNKFSEKFCQSIDNGATSENAAESAATQLSKGLFFSPLMNEIMSVPKEEIVVSLSNNIFEKCGDELVGRKEEIDNNLLQLAKKIPSRSSKSFQIAPIRQTPPS